MRQAKITAGIITKNEEKNIASCIERVKGWADEIVVVDGFSADRTVSIAEGMGARVIKHLFEGDFSKERNIALENSSCDWVIHLDADERVTENFKRAVDAAIDKNPDIDVYKFRRNNFFLGRSMENGGFCHYIPNLVRRKRVRFEGALHERPVFSGKIGVIEADIEHYPFETISQFVIRHNRYSTIEAEKMFKAEGRSRMKEVKRNLVRRTFKLLWKMHVKKKGYREGMHGLIFAALFAFTNFLIWAKYWELCHKGLREERSA